MEPDILIVGGGLAGLSLGCRLEKAGVSYLLVEARERLGGRILSLPGSSGSIGSVRYDLGPAWFWPGQPRMATLVRELELEAFEQYSDGRLVMQEANGSVRSDYSFSTMAGSLRIEGGITQLIDQLSSRMSPSQILLASKVMKLERSGGAVVAYISSCKMTSVIKARKVVLAIPPRIVASTIEFESGLSIRSLASMAKIPTWMAGQAKVVAVYDRPFWREAGLSGGGISRRGPLTEIHDASPASATQGALFGFVGLSALQRRSEGIDLTDLAIRQLTAMFGPKAGHPIDVLVQDWANEPYTTMQADEAGVQQHANYGANATLDNIWDGQLILASTEMAHEFGGYLEGAIEAADIAFVNSSLAALLTPSETEGRPKAVIAILFGKSPPVCVDWFAPVARHRWNCLEVFPKCSRFPRAVTSNV